MDWQVDGDEEQVLKYELWECSHLKITASQFISPVIFGDFHQKIITLVKSWVRNSSSCSLLMLEKQQDGENQKGDVAWVGGNSYFLIPNEVLSESD